MAANKRSDIQVERDREEIARRYLHGETQQQIADALEMTRQMVGYDLKAIQKQWRSSAMRNFDAVKAHELARIDEVEREAWTAWEASKQPRILTLAETVLTGRRAGAQPDAQPDAQPGAEVEDEEEEREDLGPFQGLVDARTKERVTREEMIGDPRYLALVQSCIERRCKLLGLDAPTKQESRNVNVDLSTLTDEQIDRLAEGEDLYQVLRDR